MMVLIVLLIPFREKEEWDKKEYFLRRREEWQLRSRTEEWELLSKEKEEWELLEWELLSTEKEEWELLLSKEECFSRKEECLPCCNKENCFFYSVPFSSVFYVFSVVMALS